MIPSADMGEYENGDPNRRRSAPPQSKPPGGGLYPLDEEGAYGEPPRQPGKPRSAPEPPPIRERKPKVYSSYAVDSDCPSHSKKLADTERKSSTERKYSGGSRPPSRTPSRAGSRPVSRANSISGRDSVAGSPAPSRRSFSGYNSAPRSRASSINGRSSRSPEPQQRNGDVVYSGGMPYKKKSSSGSIGPAAPKKSYQNWQDSLRSCSTSETSSNLNARRRSRSSFSNQSRDVRESSFDENDEYAYAENNRSSKYSSAYQKTSTSSNGYSSSSSTNAYSSFTKSYQNGSVGGNTDSSVSLGGLRKPKIDSWDSMGILGLTTKIWNDTKKRQETFLESTGRILREETSSYIM